jgi:predicted nucleic acid-binding protein
MKSIFADTVIMEQDGLTEALTADHDFERAGFHILLK